MPAPEPAPTPIPTPAIVAVPLPSGRTVHFNTAALTAILGVVVSFIATYLSTHTGGVSTPATATASPPAVVATAPTPTPPAITPPPNAVPALHLTVVTGGRSTSAAQGLDAIAASLGDGLVVQSYDGTVLYQGKLPDAAGLVALVKKLRGQ